MKLISLKTTNFKKLGDSSFVFTDGLNVIVGDNGMGKSTLLRAIKAALFGPASIPGKKENIPTWGQTTFGLELQFEVDGDKYVLTRSKSTAKLVNRASGGDDLLANGNTPVTEYIENLLGLTAKDYDLFIQSAQGQTSGLLTFGGTALARKVEEFAGISTIDAVQSLANGRARDAEADSRALCVADEEVQAAVKQMEDLQSQEQELEKQLWAIDVQAPEDTRPVPSARELERMRSTALSWGQRLNSLVQRLDDAKGALQALLDAPVDQPAPSEDLQVTLKSLMESQKAAKRRVSALQEAAAEYKQKVARAEKLRQSIDKAEAGLVKVDLDYLQDRKTCLEEAKVSLTELRTKHNQLSDMAKDAKCPTCGTQLSKHDPAKLAEEMKDLAYAAEERAADLAGLEAEVSGLTRAHQKQCADESSIDQWSSELAELKLVEPDAEEMGEALKAHDDLATEVAGTAYKLEEHELKQEAYLAYQRRLKSAQGLVQERQSELDGMSAKPLCPSMEDIGQAEAAEAAYEAAMAQYRTQLQLQRDTQAKLDTARKLGQLSVATLEKLKRRQEQAAEADRKADTAKRLSRFLGDRRGHYLQETWRTILALATKQVNKATGGWITAIDYRDGDFYFVEDGIEVPATEASGAQAAFIGVALRIGLARALYGRNSLLILDEPTESMREDNAVNLVGSLAGTAQQILLITHREQDQSLANHVISL